MSVFIGHVLDSFNGPPLQMPKPGWNWPSAGSVHGKPLYPDQIIYGKTIIRSSSYLYLNIVYR